MQDWEQRDTNLGDGFNPSPLATSGEPRLDLIVTADYDLTSRVYIRPLLSTISPPPLSTPDRVKPTIFLALERRDPAHIDHALHIARDDFNLHLKQISAKRIRKIFDTFGDGATWSRDDWSASKFGSCSSDTHSSKMHRIINRHSNSDTWCEGKAQISDEEVKDIARGRIGEEGIYSGATMLKQRSKEQQPRRRPMGLWHTA